MSSAAIVQAIIRLVFTTLENPSKDQVRSLLRSLCVLILATGISACATIMTSATNGLAQSLSSAILNQDDPETVRDGAPAFLLMLDSFVHSSPDDDATLRSAAELYAAYGVLFVEDPERAQRLTNRSRVYARQALCVVNSDSCSIWDLPFADFIAAINSLDDDDVESLYTVGLTWLAYIQAHRADWTALAELPNAEAVLSKVRELDDSFRPGDVEHYLGVMNTLRPPALGGNFEKGKKHFENAIAISGGRDLSIKVDYASYYARTLYDQELHDRLLNEVLNADPVQPGMTLFNTLAQRDAKALLESAADYF